jgi:hypothetical protein
MPPEADVRELFRHRVDAGQGPSPRGRVSVAPIETRAQMLDAAADAVAAAGRVLALLEQTLRERGVQLTDLSDEGTPDPEAARHEPARRHINLTY